MGMPRQVRTPLVGGRKRAHACLNEAQPKDHPSSHYETLDVSVSADAAEIHNAYKRRALATHPDKGGDVAEFQTVLNAFQTLSDEASRHLYDEQLGDLLPKQRHGICLGKVCCKRRSKQQGQTDLYMFNQRLSQLLQKMSPACRRDTILQRLNKSQRASLEEHICGEKAKPETSPSPCPVSLRSPTGVYRASRTGGHYAKVFVSGLGFQGHIRQNHGDAINDHAGLMKVADYLRRSFLETSMPLQPSELEVGLPPGLVASVQVYFYNRHFLGHRHLQLNFKTLAEGLEAWGELQKARESARPVADSAELALKQWQRVREAYLKFAGRRTCIEDLEAKLLVWEKEHLPVRAEMECKLLRRQQDQRKKATLSSKAADSSDCALLRAVDRLLNVQVQLYSKTQHLQFQSLARKCRGYELMQ